MTFSSLSDTLMTSAVENVAIVLPLAIVAWCLQRKGTRPFIAHLLWVGVMLKLVTPVFIELPVLASEPNLPADNVLIQPSSSGAESASPADASMSADSAFDWRVAVVMVWFFGSAVTFICSLLRALHFDRMLRMSSRPARTDIQQIAARLAHAFGLSREPEVRATAAGISPMVWWLGGARCIYLPTSMLERMGSDEIESILAHEIGHIRRGDHWVRWIEWFVAVVLWWNPVAWWARHNLRVCEEICCDAFVLETTNVARDAYAGALVSAVELLNMPTLRSSGLASPVDGGFIERRIEMILSEKSKLALPRWARLAIAASLAIVLPFGFGYAQEEDDLASVREWLESGVNSAFVTQEQADIMLRALVASQFVVGLPFIPDGEAAENVIVLRHQRVGSDETVAISEDFVPPEAFEWKTVEVEVPGAEHGHRVVRVIKTDNSEISLVNPVVSGEENGTATLTADSIAVVQGAEPVRVVRGAVVSVSPAGAGSDDSAE